MRILVQRSLEANVKIDGKIVGEIKKGMVILVCFTYNDTVEEVDYLINKLVNLRIYDDADGVMNKSLLDVNGEVLSISQFTLYADTSRGRRPSYIKALNGDEAIKLYDTFNDHLSKYVHVETGKFGADMKVNLTNDGPVTILLEREKDA